MKIEIERILSQLFAEAHIWMIYLRILNIDDLKELLNLNEIKSKFTTLLQLKKVLLRGPFILFSMMVSDTEQSQN
jgi:hypothetical protein